jgi:hypothetical protein
MLGNSALSRGVCNASALNYEEDAVGAGVSLGRLYILG